MCMINWLSQQKHIDGFKARNFYQIHFLEEKGRFYKNPEGLVLDINQSIGLNLFNHLSNLILFCQRNLCPNIRG